MPHGQEAAGLKGFLDHETRAGTTWNDPAVT
jgi:hypothetical protein